MLISPRVNTVSRFSSTARSRNASTGCWPFAFAISAMCLPASPRFFASLGSSTNMRSQRFENVESGPSGASTSSRSFARIAGLAYAVSLSASGPWRIGSQVGMLRNTWQFFIVNRLTILPGLQSGIARMPCFTVSSTCARCVFHLPGCRACSSRVLYMIGRPHASEMRERSLSFSSGLVPPPHCMTPVPTSRSTSDSANSSDSGAQAAGMRLPAMSKWFMFRVIDSPSAPASSDSRTMRRIVSSSAGVASRPEHSSALAHGVEPHRRVADERADVDAEPRADRAHVLGERLPVPGHAGLQDVHRDRLDVREHPGQLLARLRLHRRQRERAVADDHRGGAVVAGVGAERIPHDLGVVVAVVVDEAGGNDPPVRFDRLARGPAEASELDDLPLGDTDVTVKRRTSGSVDDASVLDEQVVGHLVAPFAGTTVAGTAVIHPR